MILMVTNLFFPSYPKDEDGKHSRKSTAPDRNSKQYLCGELNKVGRGSVSQEKETVQTSPGSHVHNMIDYLLLLR